MREAELTERETLWLSCRRKTCCNSLILTTGRDVWRISRALDAPPWSFLAYFQTGERTPDAFMLGLQGGFFRLVLGKQPSRRKKMPPPCVFLMRTQTGHNRCGLGELRPQVCKIFPLEMWEGGICVLPNTRCSCREWSLGDVNITEEREFVEQRRDDLMEYCSIVAQWNAHVA